MIDHESGISCHNHGMILGMANLQESRLTHEWIPMGNGTVNMRILNLPID